MDLIAGAEYVLTEIGRHGTATGVAGFLAGTLVTNWLVAARDSRKVYRDAVTPIRERLIADRENPTPYDRQLSPVEIDRVLRVMSFWRGRKFRAAHMGIGGARQAAMMQDPASGAVYYESVERIRRAIDEAIDLL